MTVFIDVNYFVQLPSKHKITKASSQSDSNTQPDIVRHEDQHEEITDCDLDNVQECLKKVVPVANSRPVKNENNTLISMIL